MNEFTDTHFHLLTMQEKGIDLSTLSITSGMDIGCQCKDIYARLPLINMFPGIVYSVGCGPWCTTREENAKELVNILEKSIRDSSPVCIGEIGLDYFHQYGSREEQIELFIRQIDLANELNLPIAVHTRDAEEDTLKVLREHPLKRESIMHCFSGSSKMAKECIELNFSISFSGTVTYKANKELQAICKEMPSERVLLETDSPYLAPTPFRGTLNNPMKISATYDFVSALKEIEVDELKKLVKNNFNRIVKVS